MESVNPQCQLYHESILEDGLRPRRKRKRKRHAKNDNGSDEPAALADLFERQRRVADSARPRGACKSPGTTPRHVSRHRIDAAKNSLAISPGTRR
ncbi:unnamed protein product, partial [Iphiclides podalirius]